MDHELRSGDVARRISVRQDGDIFRVSFDGTDHGVNAEWLSDGELILRVGDRSLRFVVAGQDEQRFIHCQGETHVLTAVTPGGGNRKGRAPKGGDLTSPMPGKVIKCFIKDGDEVKSGQALMVIEAMKMEYEISAPHAGKVAHVYFGTGEMVNAGALLVEITS